MPLGDIAAGFIEIVGRVIGQILFELVGEILIKGPGYFIVKSLPGINKDKADPDGILVFFVGVGFWTIIGFAAYGIYQILK